MQTSAPMELSPEAAPEVLLAQARSIKNASIGNKLRKRVFLASDTLERLVHLMQLTEHDAVLIQAAAATASLAYGPSSDEFVARLQRCDAIGVLWRCMHGAAHVGVSLACVKAVRMMLDCHPALCSTLGSQECLEQALAPVLCEPVGPLHSELVLVIGHCATQHWTAVGEQVLGRLVQLLDPTLTSCSRTREAALTALSRLGRGAGFTGAVLCAPHTTRLLWEATRWPRADSRLSAIACLAHLAPLQQHTEQEASTQPSRVLGLLLEFLEQDNIALKSEALFAVAVLLQRLPGLCEDTANIGAAMRLATVLSPSGLPAPAPTLVQAALTAICALCNGTEQARHLVLKAKMLPTVLAATEHTDHNVRAAACGVLRSLTRSVRTLRSALLDVSVVPVVLRLLADTEPHVQLEALRVLCNVLLEFSPLRAPLLAQGLLPRVALLLTQESSVCAVSLRVQTLWALKNLCYRADTATKQSVMRHLEAESVLRMLHSGEPALQEQVLVLLRNLVSGQEEHVQAVLSWCGEAALLRAVHQHMETDGLLLAKQALYVVGNIAAGSSLHKSQLMANQALIGCVVGLSTSACAEVRLAAVWCIINLTWPHDPDTSQRVSQLVALGADSHLQKLLRESDSVLQDRVQLALSQFNLATAVTVEAQEGDGEAMMVVEGPG
eukprot:TRINITY_DN5402_c0_g3_i9.p1 TRINITY_DN5402_c0_g3~~TRINITY_DN5402_c0_g3_i9.p1  ORF type:complete len:667 (+),score=211.28 TRINITY_DN5402_c0_g3_i9:39-2039(+)